MSARTPRLGWEEQPKREGMKVRGGGGKSLNEHLGPLRRYLQGQVGKAWDKIFADVCRYLDRNSPVQDHVRDHLEDYVVRCVMVQGGKLCHASGYGVGRPLYSSFTSAPFRDLEEEPQAALAWFRSPATVGDSTGG